MSNWWFLIRLFQAERKQSLLRFAEFYIHLFPPLCLCPCPGSVPSTGEVVPSWMDLVDRDGIFN